MEERGDSFDDYFDLTDSPEISVNGKEKSNSKVELSLQNLNKIKLVSENSKFNLLCLPSDNFPLSEEDIKQKSFEVSSQKLLKLLNKTKISISNDETRHYLNGIYLHKIILEDNGSKFGTLVKVNKPQVLLQTRDKNGDEFKSKYKYNASIYQIGKTMFYFKFYD